MASRDVEVGGRTAVASPAAGYTIIDEHTEHSGVEDRIEILTSYGATAVLDVLGLIERRGPVELIGTQAVIAESLMNAGYARAVVNARFVLDDGTLRLRIQSEGLTVAGTWLKSRFERETGFG